MSDVRYFEGVILNRFEDQCVIITGAGSGFGEATAKRFASEKANVVVSDAVSYTHLTLPTTPYV